MFLHLEKARKFKLCGTHLVTVQYSRFHYTSFTDAHCKFKVEMVGKVLFSAGWGRKEQEAENVFSHTTGSATIQLVCCQVPDAG